jgi:hypothetical protein
MNLVGPHLPALAGRAPGCQRELEDCPAGGAIEDRLPTIPEYADQVMSASNKAIMPLHPFDGDGRRFPVAEEQQLRQVHC